MPWHRSSPRSRLEIAHIFGTALALAVFAVASSVLAQDAQSNSVPNLKPEWKTFRDYRMGISFSYRTDWNLKFGCHNTKMCVALSDKPGPLDNYIVAFESFPAGLKQTAVDHAVFQPTSDGWTAKGRSGDHPVERLSRPGWQGLKSVVDCGTSDSQSVHAAGECLWAVVSNGRRSVVADTQGTNPVTNDVNRAIESIRFIGR